MFWIFDKNLENLEFFQIFPNYKKYKDSGAGIVNYLYDFTVKKDSDTSWVDLSGKEPEIINCKIKIKDSLIQYQTDNFTVTWEFKFEFFKETDENSRYKIPFFSWKYKKVSDSKLPELLDKNYDFVYNQVIFKIYTLDEKKLFIIEEKNNKYKKYILEKLSN
jgi:hypothetical protein